MRIPTIKTYSPAFKAHFYKLNSSRGILKIKTDNEKQLGEKPSFEYIDTDNDIRKALTFVDDDDNLYYGYFILDKKLGDLKYRIKYKDTGKIDDKNGDLYCVKSSELYDKANELNYKISGLKKVITISKGEAAGKVYLADSREELMEELKNNPYTPYILMVKSFYNAPIPFLPPNVAGLISLGNNYETLSHEASNIKTRTKASAFVTDEKMYKNIEKYNGKYAKIQTDKDTLRIEEIDKSQVQFNKEEKIINIPKLRPVDKLLTPEEYTQDTVGAKAFNLAKLEKLRSENKIDAIIPHSLAIPYAYIEKMREENTDWQTQYKKIFNDINKKEELTHFDSLNLKGVSMLRYDCSQNDEFINEILEKIKETGIKTYKVMVRSAFNGEDLTNYSAAWLYDSMPVFNNDKERIYNAIFDVAASKWNERAVFSRQQHKIPHESVKPAVLIQEFIPADYTFTVYTKDENDVLRIEMHSKYTKEQRKYNESVQPYVFLYDSKKDEFEIEQKENIPREITFNEDMEIINIQKFETPAVENFEKFKPALKRIVKNALAIEKAFGKPQDIEGGLVFGDEENFADDKLYIWQTRNIVK